MTTIGLMRRTAGDRVEVYSAGTDSDEKINALSVDILAKVGADISAHTSKPRDLNLRRPSDGVVSLGRKQGGNPTE
ncbi:hypothetical protein ACFQ34_30595 [Pseudonocardia benzenivorans]|uniref:Uncharacterized protein n=1 Tax=Pseudonocardia benzenivorans TaxID=228005 RepID=A0ABW3VTM8_9PSEU|nr:hypothetical protein [Pseudonocardia dioxanivorans]GJF03349.1 hypothetical protein PSD17_23090 [Pseudonocardia sp. D17]